MRQFLNTLGIINRDDVCFVFCFFKPPSAVRSSSSVQAERSELSFTHVLCSSAVSVVRCVQDIAPQERDSKRNFLRGEIRFAEAEKGEVKEETRKE